MTNDVYQRIIDFKQLVTIITLRLEQAEDTHANFLTIHGLTESTMELTSNFYQLKVDQLGLLQQLYLGITHSGNYDEITNAHPDIFLGVKNIIDNSLAKAKDTLAAFKVELISKYQSKGIE